METNEYVIQVGIVSSHPSKKAEELEEADNSKRVGRGGYAGLTGYYSVMEVVMSDLTSSITMLIIIVKIR